MTAWNIEFFVLWLHGHLVKSLGEDDGPDLASWDHWVEGRFVVVAVDLVNPLVEQYPAGLTAHQWRTIAQAAHLGWFGAASADYLEVLRANGVTTSPLPTMRFQPWAFDMPTGRFIPLGRYVALDACRTVKGVLPMRLGWLRAVRSRKAGDPNRAERSTPQ